MNDVRARHCNPPAFLERSEVKLQQKRWRERHADVPRRVFRVRVEAVQPGDLIDARDIREKEVHRETRSQAADELSLEHYAAHRAKRIGARPGRRKDLLCPARFVTAS